MKYIPADKLIAEIDGQMNECIGEFGVIHKLPEYRCLKNIRSYVTSLQQEQNPALETMEEKERIDEGFTKFIQKRREHPDVDLGKFTEKMDEWKARYNHPDNIPIKATMAFTARMFYMYPDIAREWYDSLPKVTQD